MWAHQLCDFVCHGPNGELYIEAHQWLLHADKAERLQQSVHLADTALCRALIPVINDALDEFGLRPRPGVTSTDMSAAFVQTFAEYGVRSARQRAGDQAAASAIAEIPVATTIVGIIALATEPDPTKRTRPFPLSPSNPGEN